MTEAPKLLPSSKILAALALLAISLAVLLPVVRAGFLDWDDCVYVTENPLIKQLSFESVKTIFTTFHLGLYKPLPLLSFAVDYRFFGLNPGAFHSVNLLLHLGNALLVFLIVLKISGRTAAAFLSALLFSIHPMHVESVAWISERKDLLFGLFFLLSLLGYQQYRETNSKTPYFLSLAAFALSLGAKPMGITLPAVLLLLDYLAGRKLDRAALLEKLPHFALAGFFTALALYSAGQEKVYFSREAYTWFDNFAVAIYGLLSYVKRLFLPVDLSPLYPYPLKTGGYLPLKYLLSPLGALAVFAPVLYLARRDRRVVFGTLFFLVTVLPGLQFLPVSPSPAFDHYTYIPYLGPFYLAGVFFCAALDRYPGLRRLLIPAAALLLLWFGVLARARTLVWRDNLSLWTDALKADPNCEIALTNRTLEYYRRRQYAPALADADRLARLSPALAKAYVNRGAVHAGMKELDKAFADFRRALELEPGNCQAYLNRGNVYLERGDRARAEADYKAALACSPDSFETYTRLARACLERGDHACALANAESALSLNPDHAPARFNKGLALLILNRPDQAVKEFSAAVGLRPDFTEAYAQRSDARLRLGDLEGAFGDAEKALALDPRNAQAYYSRGFVFLHAGEHEKAAADFSASLDLAPAQEGALAGRGAAYFSLGEYKKAAADFSSALKINPGDERLYNNRAGAYEKLGDLGAALGDYSAALRLNKNYSRAYQGRAGVYLRQRRYAEALVDLDRAAAADPNDPSVPKLRERVHELAGTLLSF